MSIRFIISNLINSEWGQSKESNPSKYKKLKKEEKRKEKKGGEM
jgi:hypothetical protein